MVCQQANQTKKQQKTTNKKLVVGRFYNSRERLILKMFSPPQKQALFQKNKQGDNYGNKKTKC